MLWFGLECLDCSLVLCRCWFVYLLVLDWDGWVWVLGVGLVDGFVVCFWGSGRLWVGGLGFVLLWWGRWFCCCSWWVVVFVWFGLCGVNGLLVCVVWWWVVWWVFLVRVLVSGLFFVFYWVWVLWWFVVGWVLCCLLVCFVVLRNCWFGVVVLGLVLCFLVLVLWGCWCVCCLCCWIVWWCLMWLLWWVGGWFVVGGWLIGWLVCCFWYWLLFVSYLVFVGNCVLCGNVGGFVDWWCDCWLCGVDWELDVVFFSLGVWFYGWLVVFVGLLFVGCLVLVLVGCLGCGVVVVWCIVYFFWWFCVLYVVLLYWSLYWLGIFFVLFLGLVGIYDWLDWWLLVWFVCCGGYVWFCGWRLDFWVVGRFSW